MTRNPQQAPPPSPRRRVMLLPQIDVSRCTGCGWCVAACPDHLLSLEVDAGRKRSVLNDAERCTGCRKCAVKCPFGVITMAVSGAPQDASGA